MPMTMRTIPKSPPVPVPSKSRVPKKIQNKPLPAMYFKNPNLFNKNWQLNSDRTSRTANILIEIIIFFEEKFKGEHKVHDVEG